MDSESRSSLYYNHDSPSGGPVLKSTLSGFWAFCTVSGKT